MSQFGADIIMLLIYTGVPLFLLSLGFLVGGMREKKHLKSLEVREEALAAMIVTDLKSFPGGADGEKIPVMVTGNAVIATDYFKNFIAGFRKIFGGEVKSYLSLMRRARRESVIRMKMEAKGQGHNAVCNIRFVTADIGGMSSSGKAAAMVEVLAFGTAYTTPVPAHSP